MQEIVGMAKDPFEDQLTEKLAQTTDDISHKLSKEWRQRVIDRLENGEQGSEGLMPYVQEVRDDVGLDEKWGFKIAHPTARLHELGGPIEPTYTYAQTAGWTRDGFYEALTDCSEIVEQKKYVTDERNLMRVKYRRGSDDGFQPGVLRDE